VNRPLTYDFAKECLFKCGGTPYLPVDLKAEIDDGLMVPIPALKKLRKEGLEQLTTQRIQSFKRMTNPIPKMDTESYRPDKKAAIYVVAQNFEQIERVEADRYYLPVKEILQVPQKAEALGEKLFAVLPALSFEKGAWEQQLDALQGLGVTRVQVQNLGALVLAKEKGFTISGGTGLNILNTLSLEEYKNWGLTDTLLSFELTENAFRHLGGALPRGAVVYGHLPLMRMRACPLKKGKSCGNCKGKGVLIDRKGTKFQLACYERRFTTLFNSVPLYLGDKQLPVDFKVLWFTHESPDRCKELVTMVEKQEKPNFPRTCGLFERTLF
jgi:putative protease